MQIIGSELGLKTIADDIQEKNKGISSEVELVIAIHGYNTTGSGVMNWYEKIVDFANENKIGQSSVFLGYRWPSESFAHNWIDNLRNALSAMPLVLLLVLSTGLFGLVGIVISFLIKFSFEPLVIFLVTVLATALFSLPLALILLRILVYLRDSYRATNFGIPDLVELIRQLDDQLLAKAVERFMADSENIKTIEGIQDIIKYFQTRFQNGVDKNKCEDTITQILKDHLKRENYWTGGTIYIPKLLLDIGVNSKKVEKEASNIPKEITEKLESISLEVQEGFKRISNNRDEFGWLVNEDKRIRLTFLCHSMGAFVTTGVVRILSDVFDSSSIGSLDQIQPKNLPTSKIGHVFRLGRLILVSPDIPQWAITSNRANFLRSSLRRFEEAYLFSNEGDMALLVASTSANYSMLPTRTGQRSFRLGNLAIKRQYDYGIINLEKLKRCNNGDCLEDLLNYLEIGGFCLTEIRERTPSNSKHQQPLADLFTYFDCTDYTDFKLLLNNKEGIEKLTSKKNKILSYSLNYPSYLFGGLLKFITQFRLVLDGLICQRIDTHGGYFSGVFCRNVIYQLAFGGFKDLLKTSFLEEQLRSLSHEKRCTFKKLNNSLNPEKDIDLLNEIFKDKQIRVVLSPERYLVDVKDSNHNQIRKKVLSESKY